VPLTLDGGAFVFKSRSGTNGSATLSNVTLNSGASLFSVNPTNGTATLNLGLTRVANSGATVTFTGAAAAGVGDNGRVFLASAPTLSNGIIGGWATVFDIDSNNISTALQAGFATYEPASGVRMLSFLNSTFAVGNNVRLSAANTVPSGGATINSLAMFNAAFTLGFTNAADTLTVQSGGILTGLDNSARSIGTAAIPGQLMAGAGQSEMFIHSGANTLTVNSKIIDNGATSLNLVLDGMSQTTNNPTITLTGANTYTGTTYINGVIVNLNTTGAPAIPGNVIVSGGNNGSDSLPIANATVTLNQASQIAPTATVTINGGSELNLNNFNNTIAGLTFTNDGGSNGNNGPTILTGVGTINATNLGNAISIPTAISAP
jgi:hypothetical protein